MIIYIVRSASSLTRGDGYGAAMLDVGHPTVLVNFADDIFNKRYSILPPEGHPQWSKTFDPSFSIETFKAATASKLAKK